MFYFFSLFLFYGFVGWLIDSGYRSFIDHRWSRGGFSFLPFAPSYGFAAVLLVLIGPTVLLLPFAVQWIFLGILFAAYEYVCGHLGVFFNNRRLWDYSEGFLNLHGHTDLLHAIYWATLSFVVLHWTLNKNLFLNIFSMMGFNNLSWGMMGAGGAGVMALIGFIWIITWTVNSVLLGMLLWTLIKKYAKK